MKKLISKIIHSILIGQDYRTYVLATINKRFIDKVQELTSEIFEFFTTKRVSCSPPDEMTSEQLEERISQVLDEWRESEEELRIIKKLKELTK